MPKIDGGLLRCWPRTARKPGANQERKKPCTKWSVWLEEMKEVDEKRKMEELHQQRVNQMIKSAEGSAGLLHKFTNLQNGEEEHRS